MNTLTGHWRNFRRTRGLTREVLTLLLSLALGLLVAPILVYGVGQQALGPYANGGYLQLMGDILGNLARGSLPFWLFVLGPYVAVWVWRTLRWCWLSK